MRIRISVEDITPAQFDWLQVNLPARRDFAPGQTRLCVEFAGEGGGRVRHVEMGVVEFIEAISELKWLPFRETTKSEGFRETPRHAGRGAPCQWCGGACTVDKLP